MIRSALFIAAALLLPAAARAGTCDAVTLPVDGNRIWADRQGSGAITVVFEAGFGNDSTVWEKLTPQVRAEGVQTLVYDRAGMGRSSIDTSAPYSLGNDVHILRSVLTACKVTGPVVFVGHSYGGAIGLVAAAEDTAIKALVLVDAVVPGVWTDAEVARNLAQMRPQFDEIRAQAPALAKVAIPWAEAMPQTAHRINALSVPERLPIIEIVAENGQTDPVSKQVWHAAQQAFVTGHPNRSYVLATGSSHKVMVDRPELILDAIHRLVARLRTQ